MNETTFYSLLRDLKIVNSFCLSLLCIVLTDCPTCAQQSLAKADSPIDTSYLRKINGVEQYIEIKGISRSKPVLLFIHGGPSWPATPMIRKYNQNLTMDFVLVSWDQRNCGKSKMDDTVKLTPDLYVEDAHQVTQFLKKEFKAKKILLVGNSWGSIIGILLISKYPEDYFAYVGVGQVVNQAKSLVVAKDFVLDQAKLKNDTSTVNGISRIVTSEESVYKMPFESMMKFYGLANPYLKNDKVATLEDITQLYPDYHYSKMDWFAPLMTSGKELFNYMNSVKLDLSKHTESKIPVYFFAGKYDYNTPSAIVEEYFKTIKAPSKRFYWFEKSAHSPNWEEPELFYQRLREIAAEDKMK